MPNLVDLEPQAKAVVDANAKALLHPAEGRRRRVAKWSLFPCSGL